MSSYWLLLSLFLFQYGFAQQPTGNGFEVFSIDGEKLYLTPDFPLPNAYFINHNFMLFRMPGAGNSLISIEGIKDSMRVWGVKSMAITNIKGDTLSKYRFDSLGRIIFVASFDSTRKAFYSNPGFTGYEIFGYTTASTGRDSILTLEMVDNILGPMHLVRYDTINGRKVKVEYKAVRGEGYRLADEMQYWYDSNDRITEEMTIRKTDTLAYKRTWYNNSNAIAADSGFVKVPKYPYQNYLYSNKYENGLVKYAFIHYPLNQDMYGQGGRPRETKYSYNIKTTPKETKGTIIVQHIDVLSKGITTTTTTTWLKKGSTLDSTVHVKHSYGGEKTIYRFENRPGFTKNEQTKFVYSSEGELTKKNYTLTEIDSALLKKSVVEKNYQYEDGEEWNSSSYKRVYVADRVAETWLAEGDTFWLSAILQYNDDGNVVYNKRFSGNNIQEIKFEYDEYGRITNKSEWWNGEKIKEEIHTYEQYSSAFSHPVLRRDYTNGDYNGSIIEYKNGVRYRTMQFSGKIIGNDTTYKYKQETLFNERGDSLLYNYYSGISGTNLFNMAKFDYDSKGQLIKAVYKYHERTYSYDKNGNLLSKTMKINNAPGPTPLRIQFQNSCYWGELIPAQFGSYSSFTFDMPNCDKDETIYTRNTKGQLIGKKRCLTKKDGTFFCLEDLIEYQDSIIVLKKHIDKTLVETRIYRFNGNGFLGHEMLEVYCINDHKGEWSKSNYLYSYDANGMLIYHEVPNITRAGEVLNIEYQRE